MLEDEPKTKRDVLRNPQSSQISFAYTRNDLRKRLQELPKRTMLGERCLRCRDGGD